MNQMLAFCKARPSLERRKSGGLCRLTPEQGKRAEELIKKHCCNYSRGNCLLLSSGESTPCPQMLTDSVCCRWFRYVLLTYNLQLEDDVFGLKDAKRCVICGTPLASKSNRIKYCRQCHKKVRSAQASACRQRRRNRLQ